MVKPDNAYKFKLYFHDLFRMNINPIDILVVEEDEEFDFIKNSS